MHEYSYRKQTPNTRTIKPTNTPTKNNPSDVGFLPTSPHHENLSRSSIPHFPTRGEEIFTFPTRPVPVKGHFTPLLSFALKFQTPPPTRIVYRFRHATNHHRRRNARPKIIAGNHNCHPSRCSKENRSFFRHPKSQGCCPTLHRSFFRAPLR